MRDDRFKRELFRQIAKQQKREGFKQPPEVWTSVVNRYLALPALRAFWPMSSVDYTAANRASDLSGQGYHLTDNNTVEFGYDRLAPYVHFTSANNEYLSRADGGAGNWADILGTETYIENAYRGLTLGAWVYHDTIAAAQSIISKFGGVGTRSYVLFFNVATTSFRFIVNNVAVDAVSSVTASAAQWYFVVGRFVPATTGDIFVNSTKDSVNTAVAAITDSTADLHVGARSNLSLYMDGRVSLGFLCAATLSDEIIFSLFEQTRAMFRV